MSGKEAIAPYLSVNPTVFLGSVLATRPHEDHVFVHKSSVQLNYDPLRCENSALDIRFFGLTTIDVPINAGRSTRRGQGVQ